MGGGGWWWWSSYNGGDGEWRNAGLPVRRLCRRGGLLLQAWHPIIIIDVNINTSINNNQHQVYLRVCHIDAVIMNGDEKYERSEMKLTKHSSMFRSWKGWWRARRWARLSFQTSPQVIIIQCQCANDNCWSSTFSITIYSRQDPWFFWKGRGVLGWHLFLQGDTKYIFLTFKLFWLVFLWRMGRLFQTSIGHFSWTPKSNTPL